jgi:hypothetical protein
MTRSDSLFSAKFCTPTTERPADEIGNTVHVMRIATGGYFFRPSVA